MARESWRNRCSVGCAGLALFGGVASAQGLANAQQGVPSAQDPSTSDSPSLTGSTELSAMIRKNTAEQDKRIEAMRAQLAAQNIQIEELKRALAAQQTDYLALRHAVEMGVLEQQRAGNAKAGGAMSTALPMPTGGAIDTTTEVVGPAPEQRTVGQAPERDVGLPAVAPIFDQPGVLTPRHKFVLEPSYQFGYSSADRVALVGYTVIPAILIGLIDARQVKTTNQTGAIALRYGLTNRLEMELRVPYVYGHTDTISREIFTGSATDNVFTSSGHGIGDIEATARYQINDGGADRPYYVGWLRFKSRTGRDPFEVTTDCVTRCVQNATGTGLPLQLPTGSGFYSLQPGLTWLYPSDPVVFFGNLSYLHNFPRHHVSRNVLFGGKEALGTVRVGDVVDVSLGMGLALNEKASISIGYDQSFLGVTRQNGKTVPGSARSVLGTLLVGGSYRFSEKRSVNFALGVGVTRDTPDVTLTVRIPLTY